MTSQEAKKILALYRPGTADEHDPAFAEALALARQAQSGGRPLPAPDGELGRWFQDHCAAYLDMRGKFSSIQPPAGLKDQILAEYKVNVTPMWRRRSVGVLCAALAVVLLAGLAAFLRRPPGAENQFAVWRSRMVRKAMQPYGMDRTNDNLNVIHEYFTEKNAPSNYVLPDGIKNVKPVGCAVVAWQGKPVSMLCFRSDRPLEPGAQADLWLFVIAQNAVVNAPASDKPTVARVNKLNTLSWSAGGQTYMLAAAGDPAFLGQCR